jgi:hypothetical protein
LIYGIAGVVGTFVVYGALKKPLQKLRGFCGFSRKSWTGRRSSPAQNKKGPSLTTLGLLAVRGSHNLLPTCLSAIPHVFLGYF